MVTPFPRIQPHCQEKGAQGMEVRLGLSHICLVLIPTSLAGPGKMTSNASTSELGTGQGRPGLAAHYHGREGRFSPTPCLHFSSLPRLPPS